MRQIPLCAPLAFILAVLLSAPTAAQTGGDVSTTTDSTGIAHIVSTGSTPSDGAAWFAVGREQMLAFPTTTLYNLRKANGTLASVFGKGDPDYTRFLWYSVLPPDPATTTPYAPTNPDFGFCATSDYEARLWRYRERAQEHLDALDATGEL